MYVRKALAKALEDAISATCGMSSAKAADAILPKLVELGFDLIHRDENHGPTLERIDDVVREVAPAYFYRLHAAIRAMGDR